MRFKATALLAALFLLSCNESQPSSAPDQGTTPALPISAPATSLQQLKCIGHVDTKVVSCALPLPDVSADVIVGGQGLYVKLTSSNVSYDSTTSVFSFDVTVQNLIPQALGTNDGVTPSAAGVQVFFHQAPTLLTGTGALSVANPDGQGSFTGSNQDYFAYTGAALGGDGILSRNETSSVKNWKLNIDPSVLTFGFLLFISTNVHYPNGYVDVTTPSPYLNEASTQAVTATSRTMVGNAVAGSAMSYSSTTPAVATVDATTGQVTGVAPGITTINVTSAESTTGSLTVQVCPNLAVGQVYNASGTAGLNVCVGGAGATQEYTMMPMNSFTSSTSLTVTGAGIQAVTGPPSPDGIPAQGTSASWSRLSAGAPMAASAELTSESSHLGSAESSGIPPDAFRWLHRGGTGRSSRSVSSQKPSLTRSFAAAAVGDTVAYNTTVACAGAGATRRGTIRSISPSAIVVADTGNPANGYSPAQYDSIAIEFDTIAYRTVVDNFGAPPDNDNNGRIILFYTRAVNALTATGAPITNVIFASKDVFGTDDCSNSNGSATVGSEILYVVVPDPTGSINGNIRTLNTVRGSSTLTLGHELQHLVNGQRRAYVTGASFFENAWLNETLSGATEELMFYKMSGMVPRSNVGPGTNAVSGVQLNARRVNGYNSYQSVQIGRTRTWLQRPDTVALVGSSGTSLPAIGLGSAFIRYAADRANVGDPSFFNLLVNSNLEGLANIQNAIGGADVYDWIRDFEVAMYADDNAFSVASQYKTQSWNYRALLALLYGVYSLQARPLTNGAPLTLAYARGGGTSYLRFGVPATGFAKMTSTTSNPAAFRYSWIRTK